MPEAEQEFFVFIPELLGDVATDNIPAAGHIDEADIGGRDQTQKSLCYLAAKGSFA
jgi:hypothetical protein